MLTSAVVCVNTHVLEAPYAVFAGYIYFSCHNKVGSMARDAAGG